MTPANVIKLEKAAREFAEHAKSTGDAQDILLRIFQTMDMVQSVIVDLVYRPEVNGNK